MHLSRLLVLMLSGVLVACAPACGDPLPPSVPGGYLYAEGAPSWNPWALGTESDRRGAASIYSGPPDRYPRIVLNVTRDEELLVKQWEFDLSPGEYREANLVAYVQALNELHVEYALPPSQSWLLEVNADRGARWGVVQEAMRSALESDIPFGSVHIVCASPRRPGPRRLAFEAVEASEPALLRRFDLRALEGEEPRAGAHLRSGAAVDVRLEPVPTKPDASWAPSLPTLAEAPPELVLLDVEPAVAWEQVVSVLDQLRRAGVRVVDFAGGGPTLAVRPHAYDPPWDPTPDPPLGLGGAVGLVLLALLAGVLAWRSRRPIRRR